MSALGSYLEPVSTAALVFPIAASVTALPFALYHYRRHGRVHPWRAFLYYSFIYYLIAAFFLVILPLPELPGGAGLEAWNQRYARMRSPRLDPFGFARDLAHTRPGPWRTIALLQAGLNFLLLLPFGAYLVYAFRRQPLVAGASGFGLSLLFELCQLTGNFGIYPGPYRLFDAGDLLLNSAGAFSGAYLAALLARLKILPSLEVLPGPEQPWIGPLRRGIALFIDLAAAAASSALAGLGFFALKLPLVGAFPFLASALAAFWLILLPILDRGRGLGKRLTLCAIAGKTRKRPRLGRIALRQVAAWGPPLLAFPILLQTGSGAAEDGALRVIAGLGLAAWLVAGAINAWGAAFSEEHEGWLDRALGLRVRNTWKPSQEKPKTASRPGAAGKTEKAPRPADDEDARKPRRPSAAARKPSGAPLSRRGKKSS